MLKLRKELKSDFSTSVDITDDMIDGIMTILMQAAIDKENRQLNR
jgi:shikimate kinase